MTAARTNGWTVSSAAAVAMGAALWGSTAFAQAERPGVSVMPAPAKTLEAQAGTGYTQGFGSIGPATPIAEVAGPGIAFTADIGYRLAPRWSLEVEGQYQQFAAENGTASNGLDVNIGTTLHARPQHRTDPWLRIGSGVRSLWQHNANRPIGNMAGPTSNTFLGWEAATARVGVDIRPQRDVAWAPFLGADLQTFQLQNAAKLSGWAWGTYVYAGLQGRFNLGGPGTTHIGKR
jgi:hypothetical protein